MSLHSMNPIAEKPIAQAFQADFDPKYLATARTVRLPAFDNEILPTEKTIDMISEIQPNEKHDQFEKFEQMFGQIEEKKPEMPAEPVETAPCFRCDGTKVNKKGNPCKKCRATGVIEFPGMKAVQQAIADQVSKYCKAKCKEIYTAHLREKRQAQNKVVHNVKCNVCDVFPIVGVRYKCSTRMDYNMCEACESH